MRISHFEILKPVCPHCKLENKIDYQLEIADASVSNDKTIIEGSLICSNEQCRTEYPIIDGIPIIVNNIRKYINDNFYSITARNDFSPVIENILGDAAGPGSVFNSGRHHLSSYSWDHYGDLAPAGEFGDQITGTPPGSIVNCLNKGLAMFTDIINAPVLDIGCAVGRTSFELAKHSGNLTLGIDVDFRMLQVAQQVLGSKTVTFPLKRTGIRFARHHFNVQFDNTLQVDFWACDALALPFKYGTFQFINALNVFDVNPSPKHLLLSIGNALGGNGQALLSTPYDWSPPVPMNNWVGGRGRPDNETGESEQLLRQMLTSSNLPALKNINIVGEIESLPWHVRVHSRRTALYDVHVIACKKTAT